MKTIVLKAKTKYMYEMVTKLWYIINHNGTHNNEFYYEDISELKDDIDRLYKQATMSENDYNEYILKELGFNVFQEV